MTELAIKKKQRPKNLDLKTIRLPLPGKVSILHRVSGVGLFLCLPLILALFQWSLTDGGFENVQAVVANPIGKLVLLGLRTVEGVSLTTLQTLGLSDQTGPLADLLAKADVFSLLASVPGLSSRFYQSLALKLSERLRATTDNLASL